MKNERLTDRTIINHYKKLYDQGLISAYRFKKILDAKLNKYRTRRLQAEN